MQRHCMMPCQTDRLSCKSQLSVFSTLIFHHAVAFLLLTQSDGGLSQQIGQPQPIAAMVGDDITLPCHVKPDQDAINELLEWSRPDLHPRFVHLRRSGKDHLVDQNPSYKGRTSVSTDGLKQGDMSLKLSKVKLSDEGTYRCFIPGLNTESSVQLVVGVVFEMTKVSSGVLECKSKGWYSKPEVFWLDGEGNLLSAGPTETIRGPDDLYTVSSRVTVEKRHSNNFTCRVQQKNLSQTRETHIHVSDDFFRDSSSSSAPTIIGLVVGIMFIFAVAFLVWKWRQNQIKTKKHHVDEETQAGGEKKSNSISEDSEHECLLANQTDREKLPAEIETKKNQSKVEEENNIRSSSEGTGLSCHVEEEEKLGTEGETNNSLTQGKGDIEKQSVNAGTGPQCVKENGGQQREIQTGEETMKELDNREEENESVIEETQTPGPAETETHTEQPENEGKAGEAGTKSVNTETKGQALMDRDGQQQGTDRREAKIDLDKEDEEKIKSTNNGLAGQTPTEGTIQNGTLAGKKTKTETKLVNNETEPPCPQKTETHQEVPETNVDMRNGKEETKPEIADQVLKDGQQLVRAGGEANDDIDKKDEKEKRKSTNNEPACPAQTEGETQKETNTETHTEQPEKKKDKDGETQSTNNDTIAQRPVSRETQQDELQAGGEKKPETNLVSKETEPSCSPKTHPEQQTEEEPEKRPDGKNGEEGMISGKKDTKVDSLNDDKQPDQPPAGAVTSDVENTEEDKEKTGLKCKTEGETHEKQLKGQPENQVKGDGEEETTFTNNKTGHQAKVNNNREKELHTAGTDTQNDGQRENQSTSVTEETGPHGADDGKRAMKHEENNTNKGGDGAHSQSDNPDPQHVTGGATDED